MRIQNKTAGHSCGWCLDFGLLVVATRPEGNRDADEYGPCPHCELGYQAEFPEKRPHWGESGFWRGRQPDLQPARREGRLLSGFENRMRVRLLLARFAGVPGADPLEGLGLPEKERLTLLKKRVLGLPAAAE